MAIFVIIMTAMKPTLYMPTQALHTYIYLYAHTAYILYNNQCEYFHE